MVLASMYPQAVLLGEARDWGEGAGKSMDGHRGTEKIESQDAEHFHAGVSHQEIVLVVRAPSDGTWSAG